MLDLPAHGATTRPLQGPQCNGEGHACKQFCNDQLFPTIDEASAQPTTLDLFERSDDFANNFTTRTNYAARHDAEQTDTSVFKCDAEIHS